MVPTPPPETSRASSGSAEWLRLALLGAPFLVAVLISISQLVPTEAFDAFSYLWRAPFTLPYLTGRSLIQRILFTLLGNDPRAISLFQMAAWAVAAWALYHWLRGPGATHRSALSLSLAVFFTSYTFTLANIYIGPEPIYLILLIVTPCALLRVSTERFSLPLCLLMGAFILSKNVAPLLLPALLGCRWWILGAGGRTGLTVAGISLTLAAGSAVVTQRCDTSLHINVVNNLFARVFPDPAAVQILRERDGLPPGPYIEKCAGGNALTPVDHLAVLIIEQKTRNYTLRDDSFGFAAWVRSHGGKAYRRYLLQDDPLRTLRQFRDGLRKSAQDKSIRNLSLTMLEFNRTEDPISNRARVEALLGHDADGLLGFDPLAAALRVAGWLGWHRLEILTLAALVSLWAARRDPRNGPLVVGATLLALVPPLFFLSFFGDGMEFERHVLPALVLLALATVLLLFAAAEAAAVRLYGAWRRKACTT
ncbi:MAG: hypothetical protein JSR82_08370 [Verrucomicrobia bacterium]|nr:hypothetical protein [Verrucomicrobiota bacterium]